MRKVPEVASGSAPDVVPTPEPRNVAASLLQRSVAWSLDAALLASPAGLLASHTMPNAVPAWQRALDASAKLMATMLRMIVDGATQPEITSTLLADPALSIIAGQLRAAVVQGLALPVLAFVVLGFVWHVGFEQSPWRGSPGKRALGLRVVNENLPTAQGSRLEEWEQHARLSPWRSGWRFIAGTASWLTLNAGHAMAALPGQRALHDLLSRSRVIARNSVLPKWAQAWLWLVLIASIAVCAWALLSMQAALQASLDQALRI